MEWLWVLVVGLLAVGCDTKREQVEGEPPPALPQKSPCDAVAQVPPGVAGGLPERAAGHCIDPTADVRSYGTGAKAPLDAVCVELFNGECELYKSYGLDGVKTLRYAPLSSQASFVNVVLSQFRSQQGAYGFFSRRILAGGSPEQSTVEPLVLAGQGALGAGVVYLRRGKNVVELTYISETETPQEVESKAPSILTPLARAIAESLGGPEKIPAIARITQLDGAKPLTSELPPDGLLDLVGTGPYAVTHYPHAAIPHRLVALEALDEAGAKDALRLMRNAGPSQKLKYRDVYSVRISRPEAAPEVWYFRLRGRLLLGVGPAQGEGMIVPKEEREEAERKWGVFCLERLAQLHESAGAVDQ